MTLRALAGVCYGAAVVAIAVAGYTAHRWLLMFAATMGVIGATISIGEALRNER